MTDAEAISLKERIAISDAFTSAERDLLLDLVNAMLLPDAIFAPPNPPGQIENFWVGVSVDDNGEGVVGVPMRAGGVPVPLICGTPKNLKIISSGLRLCQQSVKLPMRIVRFARRNIVEVFRP